VGADAGDVFGHGGGPDEQGMVGEGVGEEVVEVGAGVVGCAGCAVEEGAV